MSCKHIKPILRSAFVTGVRQGDAALRPAGGIRGGLWPENRIGLNFGVRFSRSACVNEEEMRKRLEVLRIEHRDLDAAIDALTAAGSTDQLQIARLKKRKLRLKDQIALIEDYLIPDIIA